MQVIAVDAVVALDARQQRGVLARALLAGLDAPVGDAPVEVLPELLVELRLRPVEGIDRGVGLQSRHHPPVGRLRNAAGERARPERLHPLRKWLARDLGLRAAANQGRRGSGAEQQQVASGARAHGSGAPDAAARRHDHRLLMARRAFRLLATLLTVLAFATWVGPPNTARHAGLRSARERTRQATIGSRFGMNCEQRRNTSGVQADCASWVP